MVTTEVLSTHFKRLIQCQLYIVKLLSIGIEEHIKKTIDVPTFVYKIGLPIR